MEVSKKSVFRTSFGLDRFQGNVLSFENENDILIIYLTSLIGKTSFYCRFLPGYNRVVKYEL